MQIQSTTYNKYLSHTTQGLLLHSGRSERAADHLPSAVQLEAAQLSLRRGHQDVLHDDRCVPAQARTACRPGVRVRHEGGALWPFDARPPRQHQEVLQLPAGRTARQTVPDPCGECGVVFRSDHLDDQAVYAGGDIQIGEFGLHPECVSVSSNILFSVSALHLPGRHGPGTVSPKVDSQAEPA